MSVLCSQLGRESCGGTGISERCMISIAIVLWAEWKGSGLTSSTLYVQSVLIGDTTTLVVLPPAHLLTTSLSKTVFTVCMSAWG